MTDQQEQSLGEWISEELSRNNLIRVGASFTSIAQYEIDLQATKKVIASLINEHPEVKQLVADKARADFVIMHANVLIAFLHSIDWAFVFSAPMNGGSENSDKMRELVGNLSKALIDAAVGPSVQGEQDADLGNSRRR